jgi:predicted metal-dependent HD superfamily phosphohydrolase
MDADGGLLRGWGCCGGGAEVVGTATVWESLWGEWWRLLMAFALDEGVARQAFEGVVVAYSTVDRAYHNLDHVQHVLDMIQMLSAQAEDLASVQLAAWFHDVVYQPQAKDNEERSAAYAEWMLRSLGLPEVIITSTQRLILLTKSHSINASDVDGCILLDADLAILGAESLQYWQYANAIRKEYAFVNDVDYCQGRRRVLADFLRRDRIYTTALMPAIVETRARQNLQAEIACLVI